MNQQVQEGYKIYFVIKNLTIKFNIAFESMLQQFKNAVHMSKAPSEQSNPSFLSLSPKKISKKSFDNLAESSHFGNLTFSRHFKEAQQKNNKLKSWIEGIGITVDDTGHVIIGQWRNNQIQGKYFIFKPNLVQQTEQNQIFSAICQYGFMKGGKLDSNNYIYNISGTLAKGEFSCNKIIGKCFIIHSNKLFIANQLQKIDKIECQVVNFSAKETEKKDSNDSNVLKIPQIAQISKLKDKSTFQSDKQSSKFEQVDQNLFIKPNKFLQDLVLANKSRQNRQISIINISQLEYFIGFLDETKKSQKLEGKQTGNKKMFNGFGVIFKNQWPSSYGTFQEGKLQGLGRTYQTEMNFLDGYFMNGQLMQGFIVDYYANTTSFGHHSSIDPQFEGEPKDKQCFIITNTFDTVSFDYIAEYRRNFHLKSLNFNNSYFNAPKLINRSPWPYHIICKLYKRTHIQKIIKSFRPTLRDVQISLIQKAGQSSDNRVQKQLVQQIKESKQYGESRFKLQKDKNALIANQINKNLLNKEKAEIQDVQMLPTYYKQYMKIQKRQKQILQSNKAQQTQKKKANKSQSKPTISIFQVQHKTPQQKTPLLNLNFNRKEEKDDAGLNLTDLVNEYHQCQTARKIGTGNTTRSINTDRKSPREIYSKRQLIKKDYDHFMGKKEIIPIKQYPNTRRKVDLDLIYREYLHK